LVISSEQDARPAFERWVGLWKYYDQSLNFDTIGRWGSSELKVTPSGAVLVIMSMWALLKAAPNLKAVNSSD
jgi:hypothetical protein